jgi:thioredoxin 1
MESPYVAEPSQQQVEQLVGPAVLEFGTNWCGFCQAAQPLIEAAFVSQANVRHIKVEDGPGRPLGRSYRVKLWPTLIFLRNGAEVARVVRPNDSRSINEALGKILED